MRILVDTTVWSLALRRKQSDLSPWEFAASAHLAELVRRQNAVLMGVVRQEVLSGMRDKRRFDIVREALHSFPDPAMVVEDYENAAALWNTCMTKGISPSYVDMLICSMSIRHGWPIFTTDKDFQHYGSVLQLAIYDFNQKTPKRT